jgi:hypothetical protein
MVSPFFPEGGQHPGTRSACPQHRHIKDDDAASTGGRILHNVGKTSRFLTVGKGSDPFFNGLLA